MEKLDHEALLNQRSITLRRVSTFKKLENLAFVVASDFHPTFTKNKLDTENIIKYSRDSVLPDEKILD